MKKRIITVLIAILTVIPLVLITPKANTTQTSTHTVTSYGDYTFQQGTSESTFDYELPSLPINITYNSGSWMKLDYNFKDKYSGTMKFTVTSSADWTLNSSNVYWGVSADGAEATCYISATTTMNSVSRTKTFSIIFQNATAIHFNVAAPNNFNFFNSSQSITISNASFTSQPDMHDIYTDVNQLRLWWDLYIPGMSTSLSHIDSDLDNINNNIQALSPYIDQLESYVDGLEGYVDGLESLLSTIRDYTNNMNYILRFNNIEPWQYNALCWPWYNTNTNTVTYAYERGLIYFNYSTSNNNGAYYDPKCIKIPAYGHLGFYFYTDKAISSADVHFYASNNNTDLSGMVLQNNFFQSGGPYYKNLIHFENKSNSYIYLTLEFTKDMKIYPLFLGNINNTPDEVADLYGIEYGNTYTRLLQSINNGIGALNDDYDTSTYDNYEQTLDGLNDGLRGRFDNVDNNMQTNVDTLFTPSGTAGSDGSVFEKFHFNAVNSFMSGFINRIFTTFPAFKYILIFGLLLLVIGVMI